MIDWSINFGNLLQIGMIIAGGVAAFTSIRSSVNDLAKDMTRLEKRQDDLNAAFKQLSDILQKVAVQDQRIAHVEKTIDDLRHGQGWVNPVVRG